MNLDSVKAVSYIRFKVLDTPCSWTLYYLDSNTNTMRALTNSVDEPLRGDVGGNPANLNNNDPTTMHWVTVESLLSKVETKLIEVHIKRKLVYIPSPVPPDVVVPFATEPYRIGIREFEAKVIVNRTAQSIVYDPHIVSNEVIDVQYTDPNQATDRSASTAWVGAPQAAAKSLVPLYLDLRNDSNDAVVFDTMDIVPLYPGPLFNIYYSDDDTVPSFTVANAFYDLLKTATVSKGVSFDGGLKFQEAESAVTLSNKRVRLWSESFSFGLEWKPEASASDRTLFTMTDGTDSVRLRYSDGKFEVLKNSTPLVSKTMAVSNGTTYAVVVTCEKDTWSIRAAASGANDRGGATTVASPLSWSPFWFTNLILGNNKDIDASAFGTLKSVWVRLEAVDDAVRDAFISDPAGFMLREDGSPISANWKAVFVAPLKTNTKAAMGPGPDFYEKKVWTAMADDYRLGNTTSYNLPKTSAKFLALEFTNLVGQFYQAGQNETLELRDFKPEIKSYYRSLPDSYAVFTQEMILNLFEGVRSNVNNRSMESDLPALRDVLTYGDGGPVFIYSQDQSTIDYLRNPSQYDRNTTLDELKFAVKLMQFYKQGPHAYDLAAVTPSSDRAFFVGIRDIRLHRTSQTAKFDTPEYTETFRDKSNTASDSNFDWNGTYIKSNDVDAEVVSNTFESHTAFDSAKVAVIDGPWKTSLSDDEIDLVDLNGLSAVNSVFAAESVSLYQGSKMGNVISIAPTDPRYGVQTAPTSFTPAAKQRVSAAMRILTDKSGKGQGAFVMNLRGTVGGDDKVLATKQVPLSTNWQEIDLVYIASGNESAVYLEVLQTDERYSPTYFVDMMGVWYNPVIWEFSNDGGSNYIVPATVFGDNNGYLKFPDKDNRLKVRITVLEEGIALSAWSVIPDYKLTYLRNQDSMKAWASSDDPKIRSLVNNPLYRLKGRPWPEKFSIAR